MKKILAYIFILLFCLVLVVAYKQKIEKDEILEKYNQVENYIRKLEKLRIGAKVECFDKSNCLISNGVNKYFSFSFLQIKNLESFIDFLAVLEDNSKNYRKDFVIKNRLEYYFNYNTSYLKSRLPNNFNKNSTFDIKLDNFKIDESFKEDFMFLTWYVDKKTYDEVFKILRNINVDIASNYSVVNGKIDLNKLDLYTKITLLENTVIEFIIKDKNIILKCKNYDSLKKVLLEFKEIIKNILSENQNILFVKEIIKHFDIILDDNTKSFILQSKILENNKDVLFIYNNKLQLN